MCVDICLCVCLCHMRVCGHLSVYTCVWTSVCMRVCGHLSCVYMYVRLCVRLCVVCLCVCVVICVYVSASVWTCTCKCVGVGLRLSQAADSAEVSYAVASMTISIDAKCYYVLVFIRSRSTWGSFCFSAAFLFELVSMLGALKCIFLLCAFG